MLVSSFIGDLLLPMQHSYSAAQIVMVIEGSRIEIASEVIVKLRRGRGAGLEEGSEQDVEKQNCDRVKQHRIDHSAPLKYYRMSWETPNKFYSLHIH